MGEKSEICQNKMATRKKTQSGKDASRKSIEQVEDSQNKVTPDPNRNIETDSETSKSMEDLETENHERKSPELAEWSNRAGEKTPRSNAEQHDQNGVETKQTGEEEQGAQRGNKTTKIKKLINTRTRKVSAKAPIRISSKMKNKSTKKLSTAAANQVLQTTYKGIKRLKKKAQHEAHEIEMQLLHPSSSQKN